MEVSPALRRRQYLTLQCELLPPAHDDQGASDAEEDDEDDEDEDDDGGGGGGGGRRRPYDEARWGPRAGRTKLGGARVRWHTALARVPPAPPDCAVILVAHEFFDALPVHQVGRTFCFAHTVSRPLPIAGDLSRGHHNFFYLAI